jgi:hypothetical protein
MVGLFDDAMASLVVDRVAHCVVLELRTCLVRCAVDFCTLATANRIRSPIFLGPRRRRERDTTAE